MESPAHLPVFSCFSFPNILCTPVPLAFQSFILSPPLGPPMCFCLWPGTVLLPLFNQLSSIHSADLSDLTSLTWVVGSEDNSSVSKLQLYQLLSVWFYQLKVSLLPEKQAWVLIPTSNKCSKGHMNIHVTVTEQSLAHWEHWETALFIVSKSLPSLSQLQLYICVILWICLFFHWNGSSMGAGVCQGLVHILDSVPSRKTLKYFLRNKWMKMLSRVSGMYWGPIILAFK